jgi:hypothetical protein
LVVVLLLEVVDFVVFLVGAGFLSEFLSLLSLESVREDVDFFESGLFFELSDFESLDFVFFALCLESFFVFFAFCLEFASFDFASFDFESFVCFDEVFWFVFDEDCLDLSADLFFESLPRESDFEEVVLPFLSLEFFGVAFACVFLFGVGTCLAFFFAGVAFVFAEFLVCALSTEAVKHNAKKMKKAMTIPMF